MKLSQFSEIESAFKRYRNLQECVLLEVNYRNYGLLVEFVFNYIWTEDGKIRRTLEEPERLHLRFELVQEFHLKGALNEAMCTEPERVNWGINEVWAVKIVDHEDFLHPYKSLPVPFHHVSVSWTGDRRIDIVFSTLEIIKE